MKHIFFFLISLGLAGNLFAQAEKVLAYDEFIEIVKTQHPMAKQAELIAQNGEAALLQSKGAFDPKTFFETRQKYFDGKEYYSLLHGGLKVPTWFGVEVQAGFDQNEGLFLNPQNSLPESGLWYAGISVPIGQRLFIDQRRADLKKARIYRQSTLAEQQIMLNRLLLDASQAYWDWFGAYYTFGIYEESVTLAAERAAAVRQGAILGDRALIDTVEATIQVQNRQLNLQEARVNLQNSQALLSVYLWDEGIIPLELTDATVPPPLDIALANAAEPDIVFDSDVLDNHPELQRSRFKIQQLEIEQRWKREQLKPKLDLKYNALSETINGDVLTNYNVNNYNWGVQFSMPIFLRKERGALKLANLKTQDANLDLALKQEVLSYKLEAAVNIWRTTAQQIDVFEKAVRNYERLLSGERRMFDAGESSLFMVNARETGQINSEIKLVELLAKNRMARVKIEYALGQLNGLN